MINSGIYKVPYSPPQNNLGSFSKAEERRKEKEGKRMKKRRKGGERGDKRGGKRR